MDESVVAQQQDKAFECLVHIVEANKGRSGRYMKYDSIRANFIRHVGLQKLEQKELLSDADMAMISLPTDGALSTQDKKNLDSWHSLWKIPKAKKVLTQANTLPNHEVALTSDLLDENFAESVDSIVQHIQGELTEPLLMAVPPANPPVKPLSKHQKYRSNFNKRVASMLPDDADRIMRDRRAKDAKRSQAYRDRKKCKVDIMCGHDEERSLDCELAQLLPGNSAVL